MDGGERDRAASVGAQRVRDHRARRRAAGLVEVKAWVRAADVDRAHAALRLLTDEGCTRLPRRRRLAAGTPCRRPPGSHLGLAMGLGRKGSA